MSNAYWYTRIKTCAQQHTAVMSIMRLATNCQVVVSTQVFMNPASFTLLSTWLSDETQATTLQMTA